RPGEPGGLAASGEVGLAGPGDAAGRPPRPGPRLRPVRLRAGRPARRPRAPGPAGGMGPGPGPRPGGGAGPAVRAVGRADARRADLPPDRAVAAARQRAAGRAVAVRLAGAAVLGAGGGTAGAVRRGAGRVPGAGGAGVRAVVRRPRRADRLPGA